MVVVVQLEMSILLRFPHVSSVWASKRPVFYLCIYSQKEFAEILCVFTTVVSFSPWLVHSCDTCMRHVQGKLARRIYVRKIAYGNTQKKNLLLATLLLLTCDL